MVDENMSNAIGNIYVARVANPQYHNVVPSWKTINQYPFEEYNIKESDHRIKTATFKSPVYFDLTNGQYYILIQSKYHENFAGIILDVEYEEQTGMYNYQCQDFSRLYISKFEFFSSSVKVYDLLRFLISKGGVPYKSAKSSTIKEWSNVLAGLRARGKYNQSHYKGNIYAGNPFEKNIQLIIRDKSWIEAIRDIVFTRPGFFDVWFNDKGVLQITPLSKTDWENTGLHLSNNAYSNRKFKFATTNAITSVAVNGQDLTLGSKISSEDLTKLDLKAFFGDVATSVSNPNNNTKAVTNSSNKTSAKTTSSSSTGKNGNPFNNKTKRIIVSEDKGGSSGFKSGIIKKLKADGWSVTDLGTGPGTHSKSYDILSSKYAVNLTIYNGVDPKTIDEPITGWLKGKHEKYGVRLVQMFDTKGWTSKTGTYNKKGLWYKRHGDFKGYRVPKAWDDNYSGARGGVLIEDLHKWYMKYHSKVCYCCGTSASEAYKQFLAGGYLKMKGYVK